jgi:hypothetical protein
MPIKLSGKIQRRQFSAYNNAEVGAMKVLFERMVAGAVGTRRLWLAGILSTKTGVRSLV